MKCRFLIAMLATASIANAQTGQGANKPDVRASESQLATVRKAIANGYLRWIDATKANDVDAALALYDDDAVVLPPKDNTVKGKAAIREFYKRWYADNSKLISQQFVDTDLLMSGPDLAIETADYSGVVNVDGKEVEFRGKNLVVWKREPDGSWKILRDIWNGSPAS